MIKWDLSQGCQDGLLSKTQTMGYTTLTNWRIKSQDHLNICIKSFWQNSASIYDLKKLINKQLSTSRYRKNISLLNQIRSDQIRSVAPSCPTLCNPMNRSTPGLPVHHQLPEFTETHIHRLSDAIQPSHLLSSPSPFAPNPSQHQSLFQWVNSSHEVAKVLELQLEHHSFQRNPRADLLMFKLVLEKAE